MEREQTKIHENKQKPSLLFFFFYFKKFFD